MKKLLLSLGVIAVFIVYTVMQRHQGTSIVLKPNTPTSGQATGTTASAGVQSGSGTSSAGSSSSSQTYKDGTYTGPSENAFYGNVQVQVTISGGKITNVKFLDHPQDNPNSIAINQQAMPYLQQEAIQAQTANVNIISGATDTSQAFIQSLSIALNQAA